MKKILAIALVAFALTAVVGCSSSSSTPVTKPSKM
ncbi:YgdI/YgdR family lipoprotein [Limnoglobus roseus]|nr:YgdI/YgdR family lipoprotein [Limnoglobus roseus]